MSDRDLMNTFSEFVAWENYVEEELVQAEIEELRAETNLSVVEMRSFSAAKVGAGTVTEARVESKLTPEYEEAHDRWVTAKAMRKVLAAQQRSLERTSQFLSRELTRRSGVAALARKSGRYAP